MFEGFEDLMKDNSIYDASFYLVAKPIPVSSSRLIARGMPLDPVDLMVSSCVMCCWLFGCTSNINVVVHSDP